MSKDLTPGMTFTFKGTHQRFIIDAAKFNAQVKTKEQNHGG